MTDELNLSIPQLILLICVLIPVIIKLWYSIGSYRLDIEDKNDKTINNTTEPLQARYGAYIQSRGRYHN